MRIGASKLHRFLDVDANETLLCAVEAERKYYDRSAAATAAIANGTVIADPPWSPPYKKGSLIYRMDSDRAFHWWFGTSVAEAVQSEDAALMDVWDYGGKLYALAVTGLGYYLLRMTHNGWLTVASRPVNGSYFMFNRGCGNRLCFGVSEAAYTHYPRFHLIFDCGTETAITTPTPARLNGRNLVVVGSQDNNVLWSLSWIEVRYADTMELIYRYYPTESGFATRVGLFYDKLDEKVWMVFRSYDLYGGGSETGFKYVSVDASGTNEDDAFTGVSLYELQSSDFFVHAGKVIGGYGLSTDNMLALNPRVVDGVLLFPMQDGIGFYDAADAFQKIEFSADFQMDFSWDNELYASVDGTTMYLATRPVGSSIYQIDMETLAVSKVSEPTGYYSATGLLYNRDICAYNGALLSSTECVNMQGGIRYYAFTLEEVSNDAFPMGVFRMTDSSPWYVNLWRGKDDGNPFLEQ